MNFLNITKVSDKLGRSKSMTAFIFCVTVRITSFLVMGSNQSAAQRSDTFAKVKRDDTVVASLHQLIQDAVGSLQTQMKVLLEQNQNLAAAAAIDQIIMKDQYLDFLDGQQSSYPFQAIEHMKQTLSLLFGTPHSQLCISNCIKTGSKLVYLPCTSIDWGVHKMCFFRLTHRDNAMYATSKDGNYTFWYGSSLLDAHECFEQAQGNMILERKDGKWYPIDIGLLEEIPTITSFDNHVSSLASLRQLIERLLVIRVVFHRLQERISYPEREYHQNNNNTTDMKQYREKNHRMMLVCRGMLFNIYEEFMDLLKKHEEKKNNAVVSKEWVWVGGILARMHTYIFSNARSTILPPQEEEISVWRLVSMGVDGEYIDELMKETSRNFISKLSGIVSSKVGAIHANLFEQQQSNVTGNDIMKSFQSEWERISEEENRQRRANPKQMIVHFGDNLLAEHECRDIINTHLVPLYGLDKAMASTFAENIATNYEVRDLAALLFLLVGMYREERGRYVHIRQYTKEERWKTHCKFHPRVLLLDFPMPCLSHISPEKPRDLPAAGGESLHACEDAITMSKPTLDVPRVTVPIRDADPVHRGRVQPDRNFEFGPSHSQDPKITDPLLENWSPYQRDRKYNSAQ